MSVHVDVEQLKKHYLKVFLALIALTALTVAVTTIHFGDMLNIIIGVVIAILKAALVIAIFMHLKFDKPQLRYFVLVPVFFFFVIVLSLNLIGL